MGLFAGWRPLHVPLGLGVGLAGLEISGLVLRLGLILALSGWEKLETAQF